MNVFAIRHGETQWSLSGQHTGTTDIPLTENGRRLAERMRPVLAGKSLALVLCSPMQRARETCELVGLGDTVVIDPVLVEWNYGKYEGLTPKQIHEAAPGWLIFRDGCPDGESPEQVGARVDRVIARARAVDGDVALFAHGHVLRVLVARWIGSPAGAGQHFLLDTGTLCVRTCRGDVGVKTLRAGPRRRGPQWVDLTPSVRARRTAGNVKGFRTPASDWREGMRGGRRPKSLEGGNRGGSSHRRWCRSMGNLPPRLDLICRFRRGRRLSDQRGTGFGRPACDRPGDLVFDAPGFAGRRRR